MNNTGIKSLLLRFASGQSLKSFNQHELDTLFKNIDNLIDIDPSFFRIYPLIHEAMLKHELFEKLPFRQQHLFKRQTTKANIVSLAARNQIYKILDLFNEENIEVILLKGAAYNGWIYNVKYPRFGNDIDLLVKKVDWNKVVLILEKNMKRIIPKQSKIFDDLYEISFIPYEKVGGNVDLHKHLTYPYLFDLNEQELWNEKVEHPNFKGKNVYMLGAEHAFIHQAVHAFRDIDFEKYNLIDSFLIFNNELFNFENMLKISKTFEVSIPVYVLCMNLNINMKNNINKKMLSTIAPSTLRLFIIDKLMKMIIEGRRKGRAPGKIIQAVVAFLFSTKVSSPIMLVYCYLLGYIKRKS